MAGIYTIIPIEFFKNLFIKMIYINGVFVIKFAQWASTRPDVLTSNIHRIFCQFRDNCPPHNFDETVQIINEEYGDICEKFTDFTVYPIASGSIAQVYKAYIGEREVAVKIKHPGIEKSLGEYTWIVGIILSIINIFTKKFTFNMVDFYQKLAHQVDLDRETKNAKIFYNIFQGDDDVVIPEVLFSSNRMIIYSFEESENIESFCSKHGYDMQREVIKKFIFTSYKPLILKNILHADLHDGNWGVDKKNRIVLYDFGHVSEFEKKQFVRLIKILGSYDVYSYLYILLMHIDPDCINKRHTNISLQKFNIGSTFDKGTDIYGSVMKLCCDYSLKIDSSYINITFLISVIDYFKHKYHINNDYLNCQFMFEELAEMTDDSEIEDTYNDIVDYYEKFRYIRAKLITLINKMRRSLRFFINDDDEELILSAVNLIHVLEILTPIEIMDCIKFVDNNFNNEEHVQRLNRILSSIKEISNSNVNVIFEKLYKVIDFLETIDEETKHDPIKISEYIDSKIGK